MVCWCLARSTLEGFAEHEKLHLVVNGEHTGTSDTTENVGTSALEERLDTVLGNDLASGIHGRFVLDGLVELSFISKPREYDIYRISDPPLQKSSSYAYG